MGSYPGQVDQALVREHTCIGCHCTTIEHCRVEGCRREKEYGAIPQRRSYVVERVRHRRLDRGNRPADTNA
jgi:hypothetical protein